MSTITALTWSDLPTLSSSSSFLRSSVMMPSTRHAGDLRQDAAGAGQLWPPARRRADEDERSTTAASRQAVSRRLRRRRSITVSASGHGLLARRSTAWRGGKSEQASAATIPRPPPRLRASSVLAASLFALLRFGFSAASSPSSSLRLAQGGAEDVAERRAGVGRAVLRHGFLLLGDFERLDRDRRPCGALSSTWVTTASTLSPTPKRSGRCSERSRERSERRMKAGHVVSASLTSRPLSFTATTSQVTRMPFLQLGGRRAGHRIGRRAA